MGALPAARAPAQAQAWRQEDAPFPDTRTHSDPRTALRSRGSRRLRSLGGRQRHRDGLPSAPDMTRDVQEIVDETDNRPMRELGYRTPAEAFTDELPDLQTKQGRCTYK